MEVCHSLLSLEMSTSATRLMMSLPTSLAALGQGVFEEVAHGALGERGFVQQGIQADLLGDDLRRACDGAQGERLVIGQAPVLAEMVASAAAPVPMMARESAWLPPVMAVFSRKSPMLMPVW